MPLASLQREPREPIGIFAEVEDGSDAISIDEAFYGSVIWLQ